MEEPGGLAGRVALVTGASRGVGGAIARALAAQGASVALVARNQVQLEETARRIWAEGGVAAVFPADVASSASVLEHLKPAVLARLGRPQIVINCAGIFGPIATIAMGDPEEWTRTILVNTVGAYLICHAFVADMVAGNWGRIINVSSAASLHEPGTLTSAYSVSKAALNRLTFALAAELEGTGVTANVLHPGEVQTEMWRDIKARAGKPGERGTALANWAEMVERTGGDPPEKAAAVVLRLLRPEADTVNGQFLWIDDGLQQPVRPA